MVSGQPYAYAGNNPIDATDPTGLLFGLSIGFHPVAGLEGGANFVAGFANAAVSTVTLGNLHVPQPFCGGLLNLSYNIGGWDASAEAAVASTAEVGVGAATEGSGGILSRVVARLSDETGSFSPLARPGRAPEYLGGELHPKAKRCRPPIPTSVPPIARWGRAGTSRTMGAAPSPDGGS